MPMNSSPSIPNTHFVWTLQSHGEPADGTSSPVSQCAAHSAPAARIQAKSGSQHGLRPHTGDVHGEAPGDGEEENI